MEKGHVYQGDPPEDERAALLKALDALWTAIANARDERERGWVTDAIIDAQREAAILLDSLREES